MRFLIDLTLDGYNSDEEERKACIAFIEEQLNFSASGVEILPYAEDSGEFKKFWQKEKQKCIEQNEEMLTPLMGLFAEYVWITSRDQAFKEVRAMPDKPSEGE